MPKRTDIKSILIIGAGPIVIGQACEFDYSGTQACRALKEEGYRIVLVNSNPATIMTDPSLADATYVEPIVPEIVEKIIAKERPDALLPTMGGQTALNVAMKLADTGVLEKYGVELIGANRDAIDKAEDRLRFRDAMTKIGLETPKSMLVKSMDDAKEALAKVGLPAIIRPSFTMGGTGGGIAYNEEEYEQIVFGALRASPVGSTLVEESVLGWKEFEMEVVRDRKDNCIIVCSIENIDPMGIHTGDSVTVAPALTLTDKEFQIMRNASIATLREIGVDTGGSNVQFAVDPKTGRMIVIEMNPRVSRSSALASKATGFPIAKIAAKLAVGYTLDELDNDITGVTPAAFEPTIDYVVVKIPRFTFEKFPGTPALLTTSMKSVGESMAIGRCFQEALQKALRSMETGLNGLDEIDIPDDDAGKIREAIVAALARPTPDRLLVIAQALRYGFAVDEICRISSFDPWFVRQVEDLVIAEAEIRKKGLPKDAAGWTRVKQMGFGDARLAQLVKKPEADVSAARRAVGVVPVFKRIDTCAAEFASKTPYLYSSYEPPSIDGPQSEDEATDRTKVVILGGGPNRIGQGIEFDYCCVHAVYALREAGFETIMVNCNPETVSTDYDTADRLYFEPLTPETVIEIVRREQTNGKVLGVICQFGGQTPLRLAHALADAGIPILGTTPDAIDLAEDRQRFAKLLDKLKLEQPASGTAFSAKEAEEVAAKIGYPVLLRPSYVLGGRAMKIVHSVDQLRGFIAEAVRVSGKNPVLVDSYLQEAIEVDVDAVADAEGVHVAGIMEHIEEAGIHSGDSACSLPPYSLPKKILDEIERQTIALAKGLGVVGLMNVQYAVKDGRVYVLEVNPRASRTVPFVAKATGVAIAKIAARIMAGESLASFKLKKRKLDHVAVKEAVFPFARFPGSDTLLGPEMKSTGEVMGIDADFGHAFAKAQMGASQKLPVTGTVFVSVRDADKKSIVAPARKLAALGFRIMATGGTAAFLQKSGLEVTLVNKVLEGRPHIVDAMKSGQVHLVFNTTEGAQAVSDSFSLRHAALMGGIAYYTTVSGARAAAEAIAALRSGSLEVVPLQAYFKGAF
ncbi:MAG: carbamoyl-phosphate synthase large subunit [Proteobacteria bacterium]|nr:carbamoyl-phosphate synthase large subunit [Pseudomonadota bacterium]